MTESPKPELGLEDTRQRILLAAKQLFAEVGYSLATTRLIAEAAGVNEVTLFRHFGSKKALLIACFESINASGFSATFEADLSGDYSADILKLAHHQIADMRENVEILRMLLCDVRSVPELHQVLLAGSRTNVDRLSRYFQAQIDQGVTRTGLTAEALSIAFDSLFSYSILFEYVFQDSPIPRTNIDELASPLTDLFVRGTQRLPQ
jgi:AcrR family transcriptional regulator